VGLLWLSGAACSENPDRQKAASPAREPLVYPNVYRTYPHRPAHANTKAAISSSISGRTSTNHPRGGPSRTARERLLIPGSGVLVPPGALFPQVRCHIWHLKHNFHNAIGPVALPRCQRAGTPSRRQPPEAALARAVAGRPFVWGGWGRRHQLPSETVVGTPQNQAVSFEPPPVARYIA
jgi:hypothetical protein